MRKARELEISFNNIWTTCSVDYIPNRKAESFPPDIDHLTYIDSKAEENSVLSIRFHSLSFVNALSDNQAEMLLCFLAEKFGQDKTDIILDNFFYYQEIDKSDTPNRVEYPKFQPETDYEAL